MPILRTMSLHPAKSQMFKRTFLLLLLWLYSAVGLIAQHVTDVAGAVDYSEVARFPGSVISDYRTPGMVNYRLALGRMQRVNGRVVAGAEERIEGSLTRISYQIPDGYPGADVFNYFSGQMLDKGPEVYRCQGRGCGSSNLWANDIFENRILYGPEQEQFYLVTTIGEPESNVFAYIALYVITRGNRAVYAHLDILEPDVAGDGSGMSATLMAARLQEQGSVVAMGITFDEQDTLLEQSGFALIQSMLEENQQLQVYVVAHLQGDGALEQLLARSQVRAQLLVEQLVSAGISRQRLVPQGIGPLAPACAQQPCAERIELVLQ
jgi:hypothetical protein